MIGYDDLPRELNLATHFVDRNVEEGRGDRTALIGPDGPTTYAELAELVNRSGNVLHELGVRPEERVLLVLADSVEFVALWYGAQKIGAVTAEAYTFLQPKDYAYYLDYTRAGVVVADETTEAAIREAAEGSTLAQRDPRRGRVVHRPALTRLTGARAGSDDQGRHRALEVHDRVDGAAEGCGPPHPQPGAQLRVVRARRPRSPARRRRPPRAEALLRVRARPRRAVPVRGRCRRDRLSRALHARADLRADRRAQADDPCECPDDDGADGRQDRPAGTRRVSDTRHVSCAPVHVGRRGAAEGAARPLAGHVRRRGARRDRLVRGVPHLHLEPARPREAGKHRRARARLRGSHRRERASSGSRATPPRSSTGASTRRRRRPSTATASAPATSSSATPTATSGTAAARTT